eukprot:3941002-Rhodomonas_salina.7
MSGTDLAYAATRRRQIRLPGTDLAYGSLLQAVWNLDGVLFAMFVYTRCVRAYTRCVRAWRMAGRGFIRGLKHPLDDADWRPDCTGGTPSYAPSTCCPVLTYCTMASIPVLITCPAGTRRGQTTLKITAAVARTERCPSSSGVLRARPCAVSSLVPSYCGQSRYLPTRALRDARY